MKHYLKYKQLEYVLIYKQKKNISIKVKDGMIVVSAPYNTSITYIEECLDKYEDRLKKQLDQYCPYYDIKDDGFIYIFNKKYKIIHILDYQNNILIEEDKIYIYSYDMNKCISQYLYKLLYDYIVERLLYYLAYEFDLDMPSIMIKKYKSKWGSCHYHDNKLSFNFSLIHIEKDLIDYVIVHELCHFIVHNHSALFYNEIEKRMPDYKLRIQRLKEKHV